MKRKALMKHIDLNEFTEMRKNYEQIKSKKELESKVKIESIKKVWAERQKLVPLYINPLIKLVTEENNKSKQEKRNKILRIKNLKTLQKNYSKDKIPKPIKIITDKKKENNKESEQINESDKIQIKTLKEDIKIFKEKIKNLETFGGQIKDMNEFIFLLNQVLINYKPKKKEQKDALNKIINVKRNIDKWIQR